MEQNNLFNERYFLERLLGRGNFSEVWLARDVKTEVKVALKIYAPATGLDDAGLNVLAREFALVVNANHKNLLKPLYYDTFERKPFLVLPFCEEGSIMKNIGKMSEADVWRLLRDVAAGLSWLHSMNPPIIHQDIKPDNIMIGPGGDFMITDFGVSIHVKSTLRKSMSLAFSSAGTIAYMAPERFGEDKTPIMANDIYSLGATAYEMLTGEPPFGNDGGLLQMKGAKVPLLKGDFSDELKEVIRRCLSTNPWERPTAEQLEKYAEDHIAGRKIIFPGQKEKKGGIWKRVALIGAILIGLGAAIAIPIGVSSHKRAVEEARAAERNDSIRGALEAQIKEAEGMEKEGDLHGEGFETHYIAAFKLYGDIINKSSRTDEGRRVAIEHTLLKKRNKVQQSMEDARTEFEQKAEFFSDEPEVAKEFTGRANAITDAIKSQAVVYFPGL